MTEPLAVAATLRGISSMATQAVLAELRLMYTQQTAVAVDLQAVGGVDAARRVAAGEVFDVVVLAADAIDRLATSGHVLAGSRVDLVRSPVAVCVHHGAAKLDISNEAAVRQAVAQAPTLSYSTGPSGTYLAGLFQRWGLADEVAAKLVVPPPGTPVAQLVAQGQAELGFQQLSELMHAPGITVLGNLPEAIAHITTFSGAVCAASGQPDAVRALLAHWASPAATPAKQRHGMQPA